MKRKELLEQNLTEDKNVDAVVTKTTGADNKFMKREIRNLEDKVEDLKDKLEDRLSQPTAIDKSVVEQTYAELKTVESTLELYKSFEKEYLK